MSRLPRRCTITRTRTADAGRRRRHKQTGFVAAILVATALSMAACSSGSDSNLQTAPTNQKSSTTSSTANPKLPTSTASTQQKVLDAWLAADETLYAYMDEPPAPLRADLVAGQTTLDLFPKLTQYYVNPALQSEGIFLIKLKTQLLNGPTTYNLGNPTVTDLTPTTATVAFCTTDTGTTTASSQPGPLTLDGGAGGARGTSNLKLVSGSWMIASAQSTGVAKC
jgi:hypothetical protein